MMKTNRCRKCGGDLLIDKDYYGWYEECIQCGYIQDLPAAQELIPAPVYVTPLIPKHMEHIIQENIYKKKFQSLS